LAEYAGVYHFAEDAAKKGAVVKMKKEESEDEDEDESSSAETDESDESDSESDDEGKSAQETAKEKALQRIRVNYSLVCCYMVISN